MAELTQEFMETENGGLPKVGSFFQVLEDTDLHTCTKPGMLENPLDPHSLGVEFGPVLQLVHSDPFTTESAETQPSSFGIVIQGIPVDVPLLALYRRVSQPRNGPSYTVLQLCLSS